MCKIYCSHMSLCQTFCVTANTRGPQRCLTNESAVLPHVFTVNVNKLAMLVHTQLCSAFSAEERQEHADSLSLFLADRSLPGWLEFCPGWLVSLLGLLNSQPGWLECLPGWLDSFLAGWSLSYICLLKLLADFGWNCSMAGLAI